MTTLDVFSALNAGSDLWILAEPKKSKWARKIDWYLNFQILRSETHKTPQLSPELREVMAMGEFEAPEIKTSTDSALMIASRDLLPNSKTLLVPFPGDLKKWVSKCHEKWAALNRPTARIFLPEGLTSEAFIQAWPAADRQAAIELVPDSLLT